MFRGLNPQMSEKLSFQQHAGQSPIHTQLGSMKFDKDVEDGVDMHPHMQEFLG